MTFEFAAAQALGGFHNAFIDGPYTFWFTLLIGGVVWLWAMADDLEATAMGSLQYAIAVEPVDIEPVVVEPIVPVVLEPVAVEPQTQPAEPMAQPPAPAFKANQLCKLKKVQIQALADAMYIDVSGLHRMKAIKLLCESGLTGDMLAEVGFTL